ncbi:DeoR/GlpR family DNA-binding transcription regulator [Metabacillus iocasae]|uniref:DeoR/GlpR family transcriptional regulator of sugar metabolism n=1 Tax=Priestia iocasae TaxID=2291674 RepID=A0ABS2QXY7_9BACI|nr:DeoR/GlpR family DNA-binding transcription regulator [Metabacillus iocasae]MBM7704351.1 DeoR/GlpR family transcriptional regulator of sugar metabolism [Metabacillus iocasae]
MYPLERQQLILRMLVVKKTLTMNELTEALDISIDTVRRDIQQLVKQGKIEKIYGGIKLIETIMGESNIDERMVKNLEEKEAIAKACSQLINDGDCIYLDSGSTTYHIAKYMKTKKKLTVVTNSLPAASELLHSDVELIIIGGKMRKQEQSIVTYDYLFNFEKLNVTKAFICASGISLEKGISDYSLEEVVTRKKIISLAEQVYVAAGSEKFEKNVTVAVTPLSDVHAIITDCNLPKDIQKTYEAAGIQLYLAK